MGGREDRRSRLVEIGEDSNAGQSHCVLTVEIDRSELLGEHVELAREADDVSMRSGTDQHWWSVVLEYNMRVRQRWQFSMCPHVGESVFQQYRLVGAAERYAVGEVFGYDLLCVQQAGLSIILILLEKDPCLANQLRDSFAVRPNLMFGHF